MEYNQWRNELFGHPSDSDPVSLERSEEFYAVKPIHAFDFVDRVLLDPDVHQLFTKDQLGNGLNTIYSNCCSDLPRQCNTQNAIRCDRRNAICT